MQTFQLELTDYEVKTRELFNAALEGDKWSSYRVMIAKIFVHEAAHALSVNRIVDTMIATECLRPECRDDIVVGTKKNLTKLVREGVLRSRRAGSGAPRPSETLYEVNY